MLEEYCKEHDAFKWLCGDVQVNYHSLSDFRSLQGAQLDELLTQSVGILANKKIISLESVSQEGMRVRASAGSSSFRREGSLKFNLELANMLVTDAGKKEQREVKEEDLNNARTSTTDPEARIMKMGDGGFRQVLKVLITLFFSH